jgi:ribosomal protein L3 glutamine methyltransferase
MTVSGTKNDHLLQLVTVRDWLRFAVSQMNRHHVHFGQGTDNAWDDAVFLVLRSLDLPIEQLNPFLDATLLPSERQQLLSAIEQRCEQHVPTAYIVSEAWLQGFKFRVSPDVLIPRSPIAELLLTSLEPWVTDANAINRVADICTGSGCLAIMAALHFPNATVDATDISPAALAIAQQNIDDYGLNDQVHLHEGNLLDALPRGCAYDLIICNPPYVNQTSMDALPAEFLKEPNLALAGGDDGMFLVKQLLEKLSSYLNDDGFLLLEIGHERAHFEAAFPLLNPLWIDTMATEQNLLLIRADQLSS